VNKSTTIEVVPAIRDCSCCANVYKCGKEAHAQTDSDTPQKSEPLYDCHAVAQQAQERALKNIHALATKLRMISDPNRQIGDLFAFKRNVEARNIKAAATDAEDAEVQGTVGNLFAFKKRCVKAREIT
jgi:hypothetical protein